MEIDWEEREKVGNKGKGIQEHIRQRKQAKYAAKYYR